MATVYISEFTIGTDAGTQVARKPSITKQTVAITGATVQSSPFSGDTKLIRVHVDAICSVAISSVATAIATTSSMRMAADQTEYFEVSPGHCLAVIANT